MKARIIVDEEVDLGTLGDVDYSIEEELKDVAKDMIRTEMTKRVQAAAKKHLAKWIEEEFGPEGKMKIKDGVVYLPLMLEELKK